jgi:hypothetical protein
VIITFEGPPLIPPGTGKIVQEYSESGFVFTPIDPNAPWPGFVRMGSSPPGPLPANGTAYLQAGSTSTLKFSTVGGSSFSLLAVDLAEYSTVFPEPETTHFVGFRPDGSVVTTDLITDGIIDGTGPLVDFQTFQFGPEWSGLARMEIPTMGWSLDNLVVSIPEPGAGTLVGFGALALGFLCLRRSRRMYAGAAALLALCFITAPQSAPAQDGGQPQVITFEGPPFLQPNTARIVQEYFESGFVFTPIDPNAPWAGFVRAATPTTDRGWPDNGTSYLQADSLSTLKFSTVDTSSFSLLAVDLAEYSTVVPEAVTVHLIGYRPDGSVITTDFTTDGIMDGGGPLADFQTFQFGPAWSGLARVEIPTMGWSLDNLVISIPEPSCGALLLLGAAGCWLLRRREGSAKSQT